jgi:hypothetical protein
MGPETEAAHSHLRSMDFVCHLQCIMEITKELGYNHLVQETGRLKEPGWSGFCGKFTINDHWIVEFS